MTAAARTSSNRSDAAARLLKAVHAERRAIGLDDDTYRAVLERVTGQRSAAGLDARQLGLVLDAFKGKASRPAVISGGRKSTAELRKRQPASHPVALKARAMWISLHQLGVVESPSERALEAFAHRQLGVERLDFANQRLGYRLIEALKAMAERAGWDQSGSLEEIKARLALMLEAPRG